MPNDDLGTFPMPPQNTNSAPPSPASPITSPNTPEAPSPTVTFEPTPDIIPSPSDNTSQILEPQFTNTPEAPSATVSPENISTSPIDTPTPPAPIAPSNPPEAEPATLPENHSPSPLKGVFIALLIIITLSAVGASAYLYSQSQALKSQLSDLTQTLDQQKTIAIPTPSPSIFEAPVASSSPILTPSVSPAPSSTVTFSSLNPLKNSSQALQLALKKTPTAKLILIKTDDAHNPASAKTKYFFRTDTNTKAYFYVQMSGDSDPLIVDKQIYVTPDNQIPSLNDYVLSATYGIDLDEAQKLTIDLCANPNNCQTAPAKAQYIRSQDKNMWQISLYTNGETKEPLIAQIDAQTKTILYKSSEFANK